MIMASDHSPAARGDTFQGGMDAADRETYLLADGPHAVPSFTQLDNLAVTLRAGHELHSGATPRILRCRHGPSVTPKPAPTSDDTPTPVRHNRTRAPVIHRNRLSLNSFRPQPTRIGSQPAVSLGRITPSDQQLFAMSGGLGSGISKIAFRGKVEPPTSSVGRR